METGLLEGDTAFPSHCPSRTAPGASGERGGARYWGLLPKGGGSAAPDPEVSSLAGADRRKSGCVSDLNLSYFNDPPNDLPQA